MKKLLCLLLAALTLCGALVSCGPGGDSNMHAIMQAICKDGTIGSDGETDVYKSVSDSNITYDRNLNENYTELKAYADGTGHYKHRIDFYMSYTAIVKDTSKTVLYGRFYWSADTDKITVDFASYKYSVWSDTESKWKDEAWISDEQVTFDMSVYYDKGEYMGTDATYEFNEQKLKDVGDNLDMLITDVAKVLTLSLDGLNTIYTAKGLPIK